VQRDVNHEFGQPTGLRQTTEGHGKLLKPLLWGKNKLAAATWFLLMISVQCSRVPLFIPLPLPWKATPENRAAGTARM
jgi:hypothetical protein